MVDRISRFPDSPIYRQDLATRGDSGSAVVSGEGAWGEFIGSNKVKLITPQATEDLPDCQDCAITQVLQ